jgi:hypothetical protein
MIPMEVATTSGYIYRMTGGTGTEVTAQFNRPANDGVSANPHFRYHAVVHPTGNVYYDPSYGDSYSSTWTALEMDPAADEWNNASFWTIIFGPRGWVGCPHN